MAVNFRINSLVMCMKANNSNMKTCTCILRSQNQNDYYFITTTLGRDTVSFYLRLPPTENVPREMSAARVTSAAKRTARVTSAAMRATRVTSAAKRTARVTSAAKRTARVTSAAMRATRVTSAAMRTARVTSAIPAAAQLATSVNCLPATLILIFRQRQTCQRRFENYWIVCYLMIYHLTPVSYVKLR